MEFKDFVKHSNLDYKEYQGKGVVLEEGEISVSREQGDTRGRHRVSVAARPVFRR